MPLTREGPYTLHSARPNGGVWRFELTRRGATWHLIIPTRTSADIGRVPQSVAQSRWLTDALVRAQQHRTGHWTFSDDATMFALHDALGDTLRSPGVPAMRRVRAATLLRDRGDVAQADRLLSDGIERRPRAPDATALLLARAELRVDRLRDPTGARDDADLASRLSPQVAAAWMLRARARASLGELDDALDDLRTAAQIDPASPDPWAERGRVLTEANRHQEAAEAFAVATRRAPTRPELPLARATALSKTGDLQTALVLLDRLAARRPHDHPVRQARAAVWGRLSRMAEERATLDQVLAVRPDASEARARRGDARFALGDRAGAAHDWDTAAKQGSAHAAMRLAVYSQASN